MVDSTFHLPELVYIPEADLEDFEDYTSGGFHPINIGDTFQDGRYEIIHKLGFGGYSTVWLARDKTSQHYVSLKVLAAREASTSTEADIMHRLHTGSESMHPGQRFMPCLLGEFLLQGPNGIHICLVQEPAGCSISESKENSAKRMFPVETARSIAAQLIMGVSYLHSQGICHGDLHLRNILLQGPHFEQLAPDDLYKLYPLYKAPIVRMDGAPVEPHAPLHAVYPMNTRVAADRVVDPLVKIYDFGTSFLPATESSPQLLTPLLFLPPEDFFHEPITFAADIWMLGLSLYEVLGDRTLFEYFSVDRDDILAEMISTLGQPPARWWNNWVNRKGFVEKDGSSTSSVQRICRPVSRPLHQRLWEMGRGETPETCEWCVEDGELRALEELLRAMLAFEPKERPSAQQLMESEYMVNWVMPAWTRQQARAKS